MNGCVVEFLLLATPLCHEFSENFRKIADTLCTCTNVRQSLTSFIPNNFFAVLNHVSKTKNSQKNPNSQTGCPHTQTGSCPQTGCRCGAEAKNRPQAQSPNPKNRVRDDLGEGASIQRVWNQKTKRAWDWDHELIVQWATWSKLACGQGLFETARHPPLAGIYDALLILSDPCWSKSH